MKKLQSKAIFMLTHVFTLIGIKSKIFYPIISFNFVDMMNRLSRFKVSSKIFFHNKSASLYISIGMIWSWMIRSINHHIALRVNILPAFPIRMIFTGKLRTFLSGVPRFMPILKRSLIGPYYSLRSLKPGYVSFLEFAFRRKVYSPQSLIPRRLSFFEGRFRSRMTDHVFIVANFRAIFSRLSSAGRNMKHFITDNTFFLRHKLSFSLIIIILLSSMVCQPLFAITDWNRGDGTDAVKGTDNASDIDYDVTNYIQDPLDRALQYYIRGCTLTRTSATVITVSIGEVVCSNGAGTIKRMRQNVATTTMDMAVVGVGGIDSGSAEVISTWYDIYSVADANATTFTAIAAQQGTALSDVTYYRYIGSAYNNAAGDLQNFYWFGYGNNPIVMWDVPISITTVLSSAAWSGATSCSAAMPSSSTLAVFGLYEGDGPGSFPRIFIRPNGSTWSTSHANSIMNSSQYAGGQRMCITDSSQQIQYYNDVNDNATEIMVEGFYISR